MSCFRRARGIFCLAALVCLVGGKVSAGEKFVIKAASVAQEGTPWAEQLERLKVRVESESAGRVRFKIYLGGTKGGEESIIRQCKTGALQLCSVSTAAIATLVPELDVIELPYLFQSPEGADFVLDRYLFEPVAKLLDRKGLVLAQWAENGWRSFATKGGFIKHPDDLKGKKMRSQDGMAHLEMYKALGASPLAVPVPEVPDALQTGMVEGFDNTPLFSVAASWHLEIDHFTVSRHIYQPAAVVYNKAFFKKLPRDIQEILFAKREEETKKGREGVRALARSFLKGFTEGGVKVHHLTAEERAAFIGRTRKVHEIFRKEKGKGAARLLDIIYRAQKVYRKKKQQEPVGQAP